MALVSVEEEKSPNLREPWIIPVDPIEEEGLDCYIERVCAKNHYHRRWFETELLGISYDRSLRVNADYLYDVDLIAKIASLTGVPPNTILEMTLGSFAKGLEVVKKIGRSKNRTQLPNDRIFLLQEIQFCPECLKEAAYYRLWWRVRELTVCPIHHRVMMRECPKCNQPVSMTEIVLGVHSCGQSLTGRNRPDTIYQDDVRAAQEDLLYRLGFKSFRPWEDGSPAFALPKPLFFRLLHFMQACIKQDSEDSSSPLKIAECYSALSEWPHNFMNMLEKYRGTNLSGPELVRSGVCRDFGRLRVLMRGLSAPAFQFVRDGFSEYLTSNWRGIIHGNLREAEPERISRHAVWTTDYAAKYLDLPRKDVQKLISAGYILREGADGSNIAAVTRESCERVEQEILALYTTINSGCKRLGMTKNQLSELVSGGLIDSKDIPGTQITVLSESSVSVVEKLLRAVPTASTPEVLLTLRETGDALCFQSGAVCKVLMLCKDGYLSLVKDSPNGLFNSLRIPAGELSEFTKKLGADRRGLCSSGDHYRLQFNPQTVGLSVDRVKRTLRVSENTVKRYIELGLLKAEPSKDSKGVSTFFIPLGALTRFRETYIFEEEVVNQYGISRSALKARIKAGEIVPLSGSDADGLRHYLFCREDISTLTQKIKIPAIAKQLNVSIETVRRAVNKGGLQPVNAKEKHGHLKFDEKQVTAVKDWFSKRDGEITLEDLIRISGFTRPQLLGLMEEGELIPDKVPGTGVKTYCFSPESVERYVKRHSSSEAAEILGCSPITIRALVRQNKLSPFEVVRRGERKAYKFRLKELRDFVNKKAPKGLNLSEAASLLGICKQEAWTLVREGEIKALSGPDVDGKSNIIVSEFEVNRLQERRKSGVVSAAQAARMLGVDLSWFYKKWVHTGRLKAVPHEDSLGKHYFLKEKVQTVVKRQKDLITGPEAARILGIARGTIFKWVKKGRLKPLSGPNIDGFGCHMFSKKAVMAQKAMIMPPIVEDRPQQD